MCFLMEEDNTGNKRDTLITLTLNLIKPLGQNTRLQEINCKFQKMIQSAQSREWGMLQKITQFLQLRNYKLKQKHKHTLYT